MNNLIEHINEVEFIPDNNFSYNLDREFKIISSKLELIQKEHLKNDFDRFLIKGKIAVFNTFVGGILFLKVSEPIKKIKIEARSKHKDIEASVIFKSKFRKQENIKYKPNAGVNESTQWNIELIFPHFFQYPIDIQQALLLIIGRKVKRICEYGRLNFAYLNIENEFEIELIINNKIEHKLKTKLK